jgi:Mn2+/Fe2+ NRAMP family transporter
MRVQFREIWRSLGPGLLWAGTAVGVSHLVQSTRAGADYSLALLWFVVLANVMKYPGFEAGPRYAVATGTSLLEGYRRLGSWALWLFLGLTLATMFTVTGAVTIVTAGMAAGMITSSLPVWAWSLLLLGGCALLLAIGRYALLDGLMKIMMLVLTVSTVAAAAFLAPTVAPSSFVWGPPVPSLDGPTLLFLCALAGWMPSALDIAVWQSLWSLEKARVQGRPLTMGGAMVDFNIGYVGTTILALLFVFLGAAVLYGNPEPLPQAGHLFAQRLVDVYAAGLGGWSRPVLLIAAFTTMFSTLITVVDGFPRALEGTIARLRTPEREDEPRGWWYWVWLAVCASGGMALIVGFAGQMRLLVDTATVLTGVTAGVFGIMNWLVIRQPEVPQEHRPSLPYSAFHWAGIVYLFGMAILLVVAFMV